MLGGRLGRHRQAIAALGYGCQNKSCYACIVTGLDSIGFPDDIEKPSSSRIRCPDT